MDVRLADHSVVQPDLIYVSRERSVACSTNAIRGAPDLVVEVLSPTTARRDLGEKLRLYAESDIREYWVVDPVGGDLRVPGERRRRVPRSPGGGRDLPLGSRARARDRSGGVLALDSRLTPRANRSGRRRSPVPSGMLARHSYARLWKTFWTSSSCSSRSTSFSTSVACSSGSSTGVIGDVLRLGRERRDAALLERLLQLAEVGERAADHELRLALLAGALAHLLEAVVDQLELERLLVDALGVEPEDAHVLEQEADAAGRAEVAAALVEVVRTLATVRVGLSVAVSTRTATPCGRVALVEDLLVGRRRPGPRRA